jgi:protocatechuate 3,4-dioxygenase beta subunit
LFGLLGFTALAQETRSTILGTVKDASGAVVPGATVEITHSETNAAAKLTTNDKGYFEAPYLLPGTYNIAVTRNGFKRYVQNGYV